MTAQLLFSSTLLAVSLWVPCTRPFGLGRLTSVPSSARYHVPRALYQYSHPEREVSTAASLVINAPVEALFAAYANLSRMTEWSPLLESVVHDSRTGESDWALRVPQPLKFLARAAGVARPAVTWRARILQKHPPKLLQWRSLSGIANTGSALFEQLPSGAVNMTLELRYPLPDGVGILVQSELVQRFVQRTMKRTMVRFATIMEQEGNERVQLAAPTDSGFSSRA
eukprot:scaffold26009_cov29-Tisochrysis_lutea.AAC.1